MAARKTRAKTPPDGDPVVSGSVESHDTAMDDPKAPPDVKAKSLRDLARILGIHYNTLDNWKRRGVEPIEDAPPYSLKSFCLLLRPAYKLPECHPTTAAVKAIWRWAFGATEGGSINPDDPAHGPTQGWTEEDKRQAALARLEVRKQERMKTLQMAGTLKEDAEVRDVLRVMRQLVITEMSSVQHVASSVRGLTPAQRADLADALAEWQTAAAKRISDSTAAQARKREVTSAHPG
jgi:hypothetical protein